jgi:hypothetical protein
VVHNCSVLVKQNPGRERENDHQTRVDQRDRTDVRLQVTRLHNPMRDQGQRQAAQDADHPRGKIRAENIDRWRVVAEDLRCDKRNEKQHQAGGDSKDPGFHLLNGVTVWLDRGDFWIGLVTPDEGRAKSPVLSARAVAAVKIADCVS